MLLTPCIFQNLRRGQFVVLTFVPDEAADDASGILGLLKNEGLLIKRFAEFCGWSQ